MTPFISIKIIKYGLNLLGLTWILFITDLSYALVAFQPPCNRVGEDVLFHMENLAPFYIVFLSGATGMNLFIERKIEKRKESKEFLYILIAEIFLLTVIALILGKLFCESCVNYA